MLKSHHGICWSVKPSVPLLGTTGKTCWNQEQEGFGENGLTHYVLSENVDISWHLLGGGCGASSGPHCLGTRKHDGSFFYSVNVSGSEWVPYAPPPIYWYKYHDSPPRDGVLLYNTPPLSFCPWWGHQVLGRCVFQMLPMHEHSHWCPNFGDQQHFPCGRTTRLATPWSREVKTLPEDTRRCSWQM